jgi:hypothetical protein
MARSSHILIGSQLPVVSYDLREVVEEKDNSSTFCARFSILNII